VIRIGFVGSIIVSTCLGNEAAKVVDVAMSVVAHNAFADQITSDAK